MIAVILGMSLATIAFVVDKMLSKEFDFPIYKSKLLIFWGCVLLLGCSGLLVFVMFNRLRSFRKTTTIARNREKGDDYKNPELRDSALKTDKWSIRSFNFALAIFLLGEAMIVLGFLFQIDDKLQLHILS